jgi:hypothetical protein
MKSYVKIYGPPVAKALRALEKIAMESPNVQISGFYESYCFLSENEPDSMNAYLASIPCEVPQKHRARLISKSGHTLGSNDFYFEWTENPSWQDVENLITKIDDAFAPLGCRYTIETR